MHARTPSVEPAVSPSVGIACHAMVEARLSELPRLRDLPAPAAAPALPPRFLRHADEQTVVGVRAVLAAIAAHPLPQPSFAAYGVVAAPCRAGRFTAAQSLAMLREGGGVTVTPHVVPQCSLHSLAGSISVALGMHGPNIGAGGGRHSVAEGLVAAVALVATQAHSPATVPGIWFVATAWDDEPALDLAGRPLTATAAAAPTDDPLCRGLAVALVADAGEKRHEKQHEKQAPPLRLSLHMAAAARPPRLHDAPDALAPSGANGTGDAVGVGAFTAAADIRGLARALATTAADAWSLICPWGDEIRLEAIAAPVASDPRGRREAA